MHDFIALLPFYKHLTGAATRQGQKAHFLRIICKKMNRECFYYFAIITSIGYGPSEGLIDTKLQTPQEGEKGYGLHL